MTTENIKLSQKLAECVLACNNCFEGCLQEEHVKMMVQCIRLDKECAIICSTTLQLVYKESHFLPESLELCINACQTCADECRKYPEEHCRECAKTCDECATVCREFLHQITKK